MQAKMRTPAIIIANVAFVLPLPAQIEQDSLLREHSICKMVVMESGRIAAIDSFDISGRISHSVHDNFFGGAVRIEEWNTYGGTGDLMMKRSTHSSFPNDTTIEYFKYDERGDQIERLYTDGQTWEKLIRHFNADGKLILELGYDSIGNQLSQTEYTYNPDERSRSETMNNGFIEGRLNKTFYDLQGREVEAVSFEADGVERFRVTYEYAGHLLSSITYSSPNSNPYGVRNVYSSKGRLVEEIHFTMSDGQEVVTARETYRYRKNGLIKRYCENISNTVHQMRCFEHTYHRRR